MSRAKLSLLVASVVVGMTVAHDGHEKHWYWDNINHFLGGFALGLLLPEGKERHSYYAIAAVWEAFEWKLATMKLYEKHDLIPRGPRSMGFEDWSFDHQIEDTILDTLMGDLGVRVARRIK